MTKLRRREHRNPLSNLLVHGWVYSLANGLVTDLYVTISRPEEIERLD